jgi:TonB family protein
MGLQSRPAPRGVGQSWFKIGLMKRYLPLIFLLLAHSMLVASDKANRAGADLVEQAEAKANIFELPSFEMKASVRIDNKGNPLDGSYMLLWNGPEQWRQEISLPGYSEVTVGGKGVVFYKRTTDFIPLQIGQLHQTLEYGHVRLAPRPEETVKQVRHRNVNGVKAECAEIADHQNQTREVCVDGSTGALIRQQPFLDGEVLPVGAKLFPHFLSYVDGKKTLAEVHVTELKPTEQIPSSAFEPPVGAVSKPGCWNPNPGRVVKRVNPSYPLFDRQSNHEGAVAIYAVIGTDGLPHELRIVSGVTPGLDKASLDAVQQWRYKPYTCDGIAIEVESIVVVTFNLNF